MEMGVYIGFSRLRDGQVGRRCIWDEGIDDINILGYGGVCIEGCFGWVYIVIFLVMNKIDILFASIS
jgi:hypothetical protein